MWRCFPPDPLADLAHGFLNNRRVVERVREHRRTLHAAEKREREMRRSAALSHRLELDGHPR
jgi:hypothetical protein